MKTENQNIRLAKTEDIEKTFAVYHETKQDQFKNVFFQWTENYPNIDTITNDIENGYLYIIEIEKEIIGAINISKVQEKEYATVDWKEASNSVLVVHRLVIRPDYQRQGFASILMDFAESYATQNKYSFIRLDAYSVNEHVIKFYNKRGYSKRGEVFFPEREFPFFCLEKEVI